MAITGVLTVPGIAGESSVAIPDGGIDVFGVEWGVAQLGDRHVTTHGGSQSKLADRTYDTEQTL